eukprot:COSAG01_NODE_70355_length_258_cov_618.710692_1_plen_80_part_01
MVPPHAYLICIGRTGTGTVLAYGAYRSVFLVRKVRSECGAAATLFGLPSWERLNKDKIIPSPSQTITFMIRMIVAEQVVR